MKKYRIIYADPPWSYKDKAHAGQRGVEYKYPTLSPKELKNLPVKSISDYDSVLFMWCTAPQLPTGLELMSVWGFTYKTVAFTWVKLNKYGWRIDGCPNNDTKYIPGNIEAPEVTRNLWTNCIERTRQIITIKSDFMGMGNWTRSNAEFCLLGVRGKPKRINAGVRQIVMSSREEHSKKPDEVRDRIVKLMGDLPRIELFARQKVTGWDCWGNEVESDINL